MIGSEVPAFIIALYLAAVDHLQVNSGHRQLEVEFFLGLENFEDNFQLLLPRPHLLVSLLKMLKQGKTADIRLLLRLCFYVDHPLLFFFSRRLF